MSVEDLKKAVASLSPEKLAKFRAWFAAFDAKLWDQQFEDDAKSGKLDKLVEESEKDFLAGRYREL